MTATITLSLIIVIVLCVPPSISFNFHNPTVTIGTIIRSGGYHTPSTLSLQSSPAATISDATDDLISILLRKHNDSTKMSDNDRIRVELLIDQLSVACAPLDPRFDLDVDGQLFAVLVSKFLKYHL